MDILTIDNDSSDLNSCVAELAMDRAWNAVSPVNLEALVRMAEHLTTSNGRLISDRQLAGDLSAFVRSDLSSPGLAILKGLPRHVEPRRLVLLIASTLGTVVKYADEGDYVIEVKEDPSLSALRPGFNNSKEFFPHTDLSYIDEPPSFFCLHSLSNDRRQGGFSEFVDLSELLQLLSPTTIEQLHANDYLFPAPKHYQAGGAVQYPILSPVDGTGGTYIRFRRDNLRALTRPAINAVVDLCRAIQETMVEIFLEEGSLAIINNRRVLHGRTAFLGGQAAERPRHINRLYFTPPLAKDAP